MAKGLELGAQIDTEVARGLALVKSGGAVALLALIPQLIGEPKYHVLAKATLYSLLFLQLGLVLAVLHNRFRRMCNLRHEQAQATSPTARDHPPDATAST